jgi:glucose/arabinose dehydrogenase
MPGKIIANRTARMTHGFCPLAGRTRTLLRSHGQLRLDPLEQRLALTALPSGFTETLVTTNSNLSSPTAMEFSPTGELWVLEQAGDVELIRADGSAHNALDLTVDSAGERGLLGIAFNPAYDGAGPNADHIYLYYTQPRTGTLDPANNQIVRYTVSGAGTNTPALSNPLMIRELPPEDEDNDLATNGDTNHNGGAIHFGPDGKLYVAVGDHNYDPPGAQQAMHPSQQLNTPFGKMLRLNADGSNPDDNPFYTGSGSDWQGSIWALGLRNPYTFAIDPVDGSVFINDVGEGSWEEINDGQAGANFGWAGSNAPVWEGYENDASPPDWDNYHDPIMAYNHSNDLPTPSGVDITGGAFYPANSQFGAAFAGKYFFADAGAGFIRYFDPANPGTPATPDTSSAFASDLTTFGPVDLKIDSAGNLYYLARGGEVHRISFTGEYGPSDVVARNLFYNNSAFDGNDAAANATDDDAIATDRAAYLPGDGPAQPANASSYSRGINGIMIDLAGNHGPLSVSDFTFRIGANNDPDSWAIAPAPTTVVVRAGAGVGGADRVEIVWADGVIRNTWLQVIVEGNDAAGSFNENTGLDTSDVFFWASRVADSGTSPNPDTFTTSTTDSLEVFATLGGNRPITELRDYNRDGQVTTTDSLLVFANLGATPRINISAGALAAPQVAAADASPDDGSGSAVAAALSADAVEVGTLELGWIGQRQPIRPDEALPPTSSRSAPLLGRFDAGSLAVKAAASVDAAFDDELLADLLDSTIE